MKSLFTSLSLALILNSIPALAVDWLPGSITKIDATYRCEDKNSGVAFRVPAPGVPARAWHSKMGEELGLELNVVNFQRARCVGCYSFDAVMLMGNEIVMKVRGVTTSKMTGSPSQFKNEVTLTYSMFNPTTGKVGQTYTFPCEEVSKR